MYKPHRPVHWVSGHKTEILLLAVNSRGENLRQCKRENVDENTCLASDVLV